MLDVVLCGDVCISVSVQAYPGSLEPCRKGKMYGLESSVLRHYDIKHDPRCRHQPYAGEDDLEIAAPLQAANPIVVRHACGNHVSILRRSTDFVQQADYETTASWLLVLVGLDLYLILLKLMSQVCSLFFLPRMN